MLQPHFSKDTTSEARGSVNCTAIHEEFFWIAIVSIQVLMVVVVVAVVRRW